jgi:hypothetical protein
LVLQTVLAGRDCDNESVGATLRVFPDGDEGCHTPMTSSTTVVKEQGQVTPPF